MGYEVRPYRFAAGSRLRNTSQVSTRPENCANNLKGSSYEEDRGLAFEWATGAKLEGLLGIDLSSRTGYTSSAKLKFDFVEPRLLCGSRGRPGNGSGNIVVKATRS